MTRGTLALLLGVITVSLAGCGTFHNTLAQDRVWAAEQVCKGEVPGFRVQQVYPDGRYYWLVDEAGKATRAQQCMDRELRNWRGGQSASGVATPTSTAPTTTDVAAGPTSLKDLPVPVWKVGDEWAFRYHHPSEDGTFVSSVVRTEMVDGSDCYVLKSGEYESFYRRQDLAFVRETVSGVLVRRATPPKPEYQWPLTVGGKWQHKYTNENPRDRATQEVSGEWEAVSEETITVPAGTFQTIKIVARNSRTGKPLYEYWYAPAVKQWVTTHEWLQSGERTRELTAYKLR